VHRVVAMVDVGSAIFPELDLELHLTRGAQPPDVLSLDQFRRGDGIAPAVHGDAFLEMEMDRVIPTSAFVDVGPVLDVPRLRVYERDPVGVHGVGLTSIDDEAPRKRCAVRAIGDALTIGPARVAVTRPAPLDDPFSHRGDDWDLLGQDVRHHAAVGVRCVEDDAWDVHALNLTDDSELQDSTDGRVA
jgi:hypothetical protein